MAGLPDDLFRRIAVNSGMLKLAQLEYLEKIQKEKSTETPPPLIELALEVAYLDARQVSELESLGAAAGRTPSTKANVAPVPPPMTAPKPEAPAPKPEAPAPSATSSRRVTAPASSKRIDAARSPSDRVAPGSGSKRRPAAAGASVPSRGRQRAAGAPGAGSNNAKLALGVVAALAFVLILVVGAFVAAGDKGSGTGDTSGDVASKPPVPATKLPGTDPEKDTGPSASDLRQIELDRARARLVQDTAQLEGLMMEDKLDDALALLDAIRKRTPRALVAELNAEVTRINKKVASAPPPTAPSTAPNAPPPPPREPRRLPPPTTPDDEPSAPPPAARPVVGPAPSPPPPPTQGAKATTPPPPPPPTTKPTEPAEDPDAKPEKKKRVPGWTDDNSGGVPWSQAYVIETPHFKIKTDVAKKYAQRYAKFVETLADRYIDIFQFDGNDFKYKKNELFIYNGQKEFQREEPDAVGALGFYEPWSKRLVTFHGTPEGEDDATTPLSILAHECTHQFENLKLREINHAPIFLIEGLANFFESTEIKDNGDVICGKIAPRYLETLQKMIKDGTIMSLQDVMATPHRSFGYVHYAHAWGIFYWCWYGPEKKKAPKLVESFFQQCCAKPTTAGYFEEGLEKLGYPIAKFEKHWREWIAQLDLKKDQAQADYEAWKKKHPH